MSSSKASLRCGIACFALAVVFCALPRANYAQVSEPARVPEAQPPAVPFSTPTCIVLELFDDGTTIHYETSCCESSAHYGLFFSPTPKDAIECEFREENPNCPPLTVDFILGTLPCCGCSGPDADKPTFGVLGQGIDAETQKWMDSQAPRPADRPYCHGMGNNRKAVKFHITTDDPALAGKTFVFYRRVIHKKNKELTVVIEVPSGDLRFEPAEFVQGFSVTAQGACALNNDGVDSSGPLKTVTLKFENVPGPMKDFTDCAVILLRDANLWKVAR